MGWAGAERWAGFEKKLFERERSGLNRPLKVRSHQHCVEQYITGCYHLTNVFYSSRFYVFNVFWNFNFNVFTSMVPRTLASCYFCEINMQSLSGAWAEWVENWLSRSGAGVGGPRSGSGAGSGCHKNRLERWVANRPLTLRSHALGSRPCSYFIAISTYIYLHYY